LADRLARNHLVITAAGVWRVERLRGATQRDESPAVASTPEVLCGSDQLGRMLKQTGGFIPKQQPATRLRRRHRSLTRVIGDRPMLVHACFNPLVRQMPRQLIAGKAALR